MSDTENQMKRAEHTAEAVKESSATAQPMVPKEAELLPPESPKFDRPFQNPNTLINVTETFVNADVEMCLILSGKLKEILEEEVPSTPPPHDWYAFALTAVAIIATIVTPPTIFPWPELQNPFCEFWRVCSALGLMWIFLHSKNAHRRSKSLRRNKQTIISAILKKVKGK